MLLVFLSVALAMASWLSLSSDEVSDNIESNRVLTARSLAHSAVENHLISAASAKFNTDSENICRLNDSTYVVSGQVDSHNGVNAMYRSEYRCTIVLTSAETGRCTAIFME